MVANQSSDNKAIDSRRKIVLLVFLLPSNCDKYERVRELFNVRLF